MKKADYAYLIVNYVIAILAVALTGNSTVYNPIASDYLTAGIGSMLGSLFMVSIITLPVQFFSGWEKYSYIRKTLISSIVLQVILLISKLI